MSCRLDPNHPKSVSEMLDCDHILSVQHQERFVMLRPQEDQEGPATDPGRDRLAERCVAEIVIDTQDGRRASAAARTGA